MLFGVYAGKIPSRIILTILYQPLSRPGISKFKSLQTWNGASLEVRIRVLSSKLWRTLLVEGGVMHSVGDGSSWPRHYCVHRQWRISWYLHYVSLRKQCWNVICRMQHWFGRWVECDWLWHLRCEPANTASNIVDARSPLRFVLDRQNLGWFVVLNLIHNIFQTSTTRSIFRLLIHPIGRCWMTYHACGVFGIKMTWTFLPHDRINHCKEQDQFYNSCTVVFHKAFYKSLTEIKISTSCGRSTVMLRLVRMWSILLGCCKWRCIGVLVLRARKSCSNDLCIRLASSEVLA